MKALPSGPAPALNVLRHPLVILVALACGVFLGHFAHGVGASLRPVGTIYLFLLRMTLIPILAAAIAAGVARLVSEPRALGVLVRSIFVLLVAFAVVAAIAVVIGVIARPGTQIGDANTAYLGRLIRDSSQGSGLSISLGEQSSLRPKTTLLDLLTGIVPENIFSALSSGSTVQVVFFALLLGVAIGLLRDQQREYLIDISLKTLEGFKRVNLWLIYALPVGAVCLISEQVAQSGFGALHALARFLVVFLVATGAAALLFLLALWLRSGRTLRESISALVEPLTYAFITSSSLIAVPYALRALEERLGCRRETTNAVVPFATVVGRVGYVLYFTLAGVFVANFYGVTLGATDYLTLAVGAAVAAVASSGLTGAAALGSLTLAFGPLGLPAEPAVVIFAGADLVVSPIAASLDVLANMTVSVFVAVRSEHYVRAHAGARAVRRISLRTSVVLLLASLIVLTGLVTIGLTYSAQRKDVSYLADGMINEISGRVVQRTANYFSPAERSVQSLQYLLEHGYVDAGKRSELLDVMRSALDENPEFAAVYFGDTSGNFTMVKRMPDGSISNRLITRTTSNVQIVWQHANPEYAVQFPSEVDSLADGYDPRTRGWYTEALKQSREIWTSVYLFASDNMLGVSNAIPIYTGTSGGGSTGAAAEKPAGVLAVDIGLAELSYFLGGLDVSESGKAYILDEKNDLVALSMPRGSDLSALFSQNSASASAAATNLILADESKDPLVRRSFLAYLPLRDKEESFPFRSGGVSYLGRVVDFPNTASFNWKIGIVLPESQIYGYVDRTSRVVLYAALLIIVVSIGLGVSFSRAITQPLRQLSRDMERIRNFDLGGHDAIVSRIAEVHNMAGAFSDMKHGLSAFNKYVPSKLVAQLIRLGEEPRIGGKRGDLTIMFSDIADFTTITENLSPEALIDEMAVYFNALGNVIIQHRGTVDKYIGDAIMAFWNAPAPVEDHAVMACRAAIGCQKVLKALSERMPSSSGAMSAARRSILAARTRIGIHTGEVIVGNMGSEERLNYTAVGDGVNLASRLEGLNKFYGTRIIMSETTHAAAGGALVARRIDRVAVKGRAQGLDVYELVGTSDDTPEDEKRFCEAATQCVDRYLTGAFSEAIDLITRAERLRPGDRPLSIIRSRCESYLTSAPEEGWNGVYVHHEK